MRRFLCGIFILANTLTVYYAALRLAGNVEPGWMWLVQGMLYAPYYLPLLSFLIYLKKSDKFANE